jgi:Ca2+-transporting ATPase
MTARTAIAQRSEPIPPGGLTAAQVEAARAEAGWNELPAAERASPWAVLGRQFRGLLVLILIGAAAAALLLGERIDAIAIGLVVALNGALGFVQEWRAETALEALRSMLSPEAVVIRQGRERRIPAREIVPGDLVVVSAGDRVPADLEAVEVLALRVGESALTGESVPVGRGVGDPLHAGTTVTAGRAVGRTTAIGAGTAFGRIADLTGSVGDKTTNLQRHLGRLAGQLGAAAILVAAAVAVLGVATGRPLGEMAMTGLSLAVGLVPEGLPAVVTITLALGASAMARQRALARRLQAVETLGAASVICTDKTGTLTENAMTAVRIWAADAEYAVTGTGYDPAGHIELGGERVRAAGDPRLSALLETAQACNRATVAHGEAGWEMVGEPTEGALATLALKGWHEPGGRVVLGEVPFSSERKRMSVLARRDGATTLHMKGAPERVLEACDSIREGGGDASLDAGARRRVRAAYEAMAEEGLRVLALASRPAGPDDLGEEGLTLLGLVGLIDPPRPEVPAAIAAARGAGVRVIMITGNGAVTARAVAARLGLPAARAIEGDALDALDDDALRDALEGEVLFARARPEHKMRIVEALQAGGAVVAMTGDGVNDAPALKRADIGVAMGVRGTDVARDASDLVLLDDDFATIVRAIREGRRQFDNITKFVRYLLSSNAGEVVAITAGLLLGGPLIFLPTQILWMNLVTDGVTAVALGLEPAEGDQMREPPREPDAPILGAGGVGLILAFGVYTGAASLWLFHTLLPLGVDLARTAAFTGMIVFEKVSVFAFRSLRRPCWRIGWASNPLLLGALAITIGVQVAAVYWPPLQVLLRTVPLGLDHWATIAALALPLVVVPEIVKTVRSRGAPAPA